MTRTAITFVAGFGLGVLVAYILLVWDLQANGPPRA